MDMPPHPASRAAARIEALSSFMKFSPSVKKTLKANAAGAV
jgi:hypothetical protein